MMDLNEFRSSFFTHHMMGDVAVLTMTSIKLTAEENLEEFDKDLLAIVDTYNARKVIIRFNSVRYLSSEAIGKLIGLHRHLIREEGRVVLCDLQDVVADILSTSHLLNYFKVTLNLDDAIATINESENTP